MSQRQQLTLQYTLHPLISQLNMDLLLQNPYNPLQFIKLWATKKIKQLYAVDESSSEQEEIEKQLIVNINKKIIQTKGSLSLYTRTQPKHTPIIKRRNAVFFTPQLFSSQHNQVSKSQQTRSRIMISLKNDPFFKHLSWQQISHFVQIGKVFQTDESTQVIQHINEPITEFFIVVSGEVVLLDMESEEVKTYYTGECMCHESFLHSVKSRFSYFCRQPKTLLFTLLGTQIKNTIEAFQRQRFEFFQKALMNKEEFNYLDNEERDKLICCFTSRKEIMTGEVVFRGQAESIALKDNKGKRFYVVVKGQFSKCKKSTSGELMTFKTLRQGDFFGEENLLEYAAIDYSVICLQDNSEIAYVEKGLLEQSVDSYKRIVQRAKMQVKYVVG